MAGDKGPLKSPVEAAGISSPPRPENVAIWFLAPSRSVPKDEISGSGSLSLVMVYVASRCLSIVGEVLC